MKYFDKDGKRAANKPLSVKEVAELLKKQTWQQRKEAWKTMKQDKARHCQKCGSMLVDALDQCCKMPKTNRTY